MHMCGYANYQDPRLACPPEEPEIPTCAECAFMRVVTARKHQDSNGFVHEMSTCVCVFDVYNAADMDELSDADLERVRPDMEACVDFKEQE